MLDPLEHAVEAVGEPVELVAGAGHFEPPGKVAGNDPAAGRADRVDALQHAAADEEPAQHRQPDHQRRRPGERPADDLAKLLALADVAADQHPEAARQPQHLDHGDVARALADIALVGDRDRADAGPLEDVGRHLADIAGQDAAVDVGDQVEARARLVAALLDGLEDRRDAAAAALFGEAANFGGDRRAELVVEEDVGGVGDVEDEGHREDREDRDVDGGKLERGCADDLTERCHGSCIRRRAPYAAAARRSPCRSCRAAARYARR